MKRSGEWDPDFGRVPTGRGAARALRRGRRRRRSSCRAARPTSRPTTPCSRRRSSARASSRASSLDDIADVRQRDRAVPQPVAVPAREARGRDRRRVQGPHPPDVPRAARPRPRPAACSCRRSSTATSRPTATATTSSSGPTRRARPRRPGSTSRASRSTPFLCIADFFRPVESRRGRLRRVPHRHDGRRASARRRPSCSPTTEYQEYLLLHGLGVEMAEALAEYWHRRIREEWGFVDEDGPTIGGLFRQQYRGGRYSWGYPACPDLEDNATVARAARRRPPRHRGQRGDRLAVPARADHLGDHLPPPPGQVLRRPLTTIWVGSVLGTGSVPEAGTIPAQLRGPS